MAGRGWHSILGLAATASAVYLGLATAGDLRGRPAVLLPAVALLSGAMLGALRVVRREPRLLGPALVAALVFRVVAGLGPPALSDDVHRYVWDGRVQLHGVHPYRFAPAAPELAALHTGDSRAINHPELRTIYPPLAELFFLGAAALGAGSVGMKLLLGGIDFGVVLVLDRWLVRSSLPRARLILYAWNPLAVLETAGSGHLEPLGVLLVLLAGLWLAGGRPVRATVALAAAVHVKLLPLVLVPALLHRTQAARAALVLGIALALPFLPYAVGGPPIGPGLVDYAERWEHNATIFDAVRTVVVRQDASRLVVLAVALAWVGWLARRRERPFPREALLAFGGVLLLAPTLHPWYLLWVLPWAMLVVSGGWLVLGGTAFLSYALPDGDVPAGLKLLEFGPPLVVALWGFRGTWRGDHG